jgi:hypothetical protein
MGGLPELKPGQQRLHLVMGHGHGMAMAWMGHILQWILLRKPASGGCKFFCVQVQPRSWPRVHKKQKSNDTQLQQLLLYNIVLPW